MAYEARSLLRPDGNRASKKGTNDRPTSSSDEWSSSCSSASPVSQRSSDEDYACEWESYVARDGTLFYLEYNIQPAIAANATHQSTAEKGQTLLALRNDLKRSSMRRSKKTGMRLSNLINGNHKAHKEAMKKRANASHPPGTSKSGAVGKSDQPGGDSTNKVKFNEMVEGELKEITVFIDPSMRHKFGRRTTLAEALLGVSVCPFPNSNRIMIAGYMPNSEISQAKAIKIGDWLKSVNDQDISVDNFELILLSYTQPTYIKLQLKRIAVEEPPPSHALNIGKATSTAEYAEALQALLAPSSSDDFDLSAVFNVLVITLKDKAEHRLNAEDVIFCYPPRENNRLYSLRGIFLTMNSLFRECTFNSKPKVSRVSIQNVEHFVAYHSTSDDLFLMSIPTRRISLQDAKLKLATIIRSFELCFRHLSLSILPQPLPPQQAPAENESINGTHNRNFAITDTCSIIKFQLGRTLPLHARFQDVLTQPHFIPLPKEGQLRVDDALSEMEAMDYREWNDEPLKSHREFYISGSALYYRKYLLASHLSKSDLLDVEAFLRVHGVYTLIDNKPVNELVIWREVYPKSVSGGFFDAIAERNANRSSRWFLTIVAKNQLFMAVLLESRHSIDVDEAASSAAHATIGPSRFYIDEIQDTLDYLQTGGVENLATTWLNSNKRPEMVLFKEDHCVPLLLAPNQSSHGQALNVSAATSSSASTVEALAMGLKSTEVISILKRRNNSNENVNDNLKLGSALVAQSAAGGSPSLNSQTYGDGSLHKYDDDDDGSDSDWDGFPESQRSSSGFDMSEMTSTFFREITDVILSKVTAGKDNVLYNYVLVEVSEGTILAPPNLQSINSVAVAFQKASTLIHNILQNSLRFRHLLTRETTTTNIHRSLVAIKEHGMLISLENCNHPPFWVVGRLFTNPTKELYVCHRADIPQNLVEIAFRLTLHSAG